MVADRALTHPGPFRSHTYTLGTYLGIRVGGVAAMGASGCICPAIARSKRSAPTRLRGRGYARTTSYGQRRDFDEGLTPFCMCRKNLAAQLRRFVRRPRDAGCRCSSSNELNLKSKSELEVQLKAQSALYWHAAPGFAGSGAGRRRRHHKMEMAVVLSRWSGCG